MKLILLRSKCDNARVCPNINATDRGTLVVQGYTISDAAPLVDLALGSADTVVEVPLSLLPELAAAAVHRPGLRVTDRGTVLIWGCEVTDPEALQELNLPTGEAAIEVAASMLPEVAAHAQ